MRTTARGLAAILAALFLVFGVLFMFSPEGRLAGAGLEATSNLGLATMRAMIGASFLAFGILLVMHTVIAQQTGALRFAILFLLLSVIGRVISLVADGSGNDAVRNVVPVSLMFVGAVAALVLFRRSEPAE